MADKYVGTENYKKSVAQGKISDPPYQASVDMDKKQQNDFFVKWGNWIWSEYLFSDYMFNPQCLPIASGRKYSLQEIRQYALGEQNIRRYQEILDDCQDKDKGYMNINWDNTKIASKFRDLVKGKMLSVDFDFRTQAIDETSQKARLGYKNKMKAIISPQMKQFAQAAGIKPDIQVPEDVNTPDDVDLIERMGGFRLDREMFAKDAIESTKYDSGYNVLKTQMIEDIIDWNRCACRVYVEKTTNKVKYDYVNPLQVIIADSKYPDFRDAVYAAVVHTKTISQIRKESNLTEEELYHIAKIYRGTTYNSKYGNVLPSAYRINDTNNLNGFHGDNSFNNWDNFQVEVLEYYFVCKEVEKYIVGEREGKEFFEKVKTYSKLNSNDEKKGKSFQEIHTETVYRGNMIVGTEFVFDCGKEYGVAKKSKNGVREVLLPIQVYADRSPSLMERCIPFIDDLQLAVLKKRNLLAKMPPGPRIALDLSILKDSIFIGKKQWTVVDLLSLYSKTGVFPYASRSEYNTGELGSNRPPIDVLPSGVAEDFQLLMQEALTQIDNIRQVTGINEVADGSTQQQDMLAGVMSGLNAATNNALKPLFECYKNFTEIWSKTCLLKWQAALVAGDIDIEFVPMGDELLKRVKLTEDLYNVDFGITISVLPSEEERNIFLQDLMMQKQQGTIDVADYFILMRMVKSGDLKRAELFLAKSVKKQQQLTQQQEMQKIEAQAQANAQAAQAAEMARAQTVQQQTQAHIALEQAKGEEHRRNLQLEYELKMQLERVKQEAQLGNDMSNSVLNDALANQPVPPPTSILDENLL